MAKTVATLEQIIAQTNKDAKNNVIGMGFEKPEVKTIPFSILQLNRMTCGGLQIGKAHEFMGAENGGKTTTALSLIASAQRVFPDKTAVFVDVEQTFDAEWAEQMGVDVDSLLVYQPNEETPASKILGTIEDFAKTGEVSIIVLDSIAAMISDQESEKQIGDRTFAGVSVEMTQFSHKIAPILRRTGTTLVALNQLRDSMGTYGPVTKTPGGRAWKHLCSARIEFKKGPFIDENGNDVKQDVVNPYGNRILATLRKNKGFKATYRIASYTLRYDIGLDATADLVEAALGCGVLDRAGAFYKFSYGDGKDPVKWQGISKVRAEVDQDDKLYEAMYAQTMLALTSD